MKTFELYLKEREEAGLGYLAPSDTAANELLYRISRIAIDNHYKEVMKFFESLAEKDSQIQTELDQYKEERKKGIFGKTSYDGNFTNDRKEIDQIVPNSADTAGGELN